MDKYVWDSGDVTTVTNKSIVCAGCIHKHKNAGTCTVYPDHKPLNILKGAECSAKQSK